MTSSSTVQSRQPSQQIKKKSNSLSIKLQNLYSFLSIPSLGYQARIVLVFSAEQLLSESLDAAASPTWELSSFELESAKKKLV